MDAFCFTDIFSPLTRITPEQSSCLRVAYIKAGFQVPSRAQLRALSESMGIQQTHLRRWFATQTETEPLVSEQLFADKIVVLEQRSKLLDQQITRLQTELSSTKCLFASFYLW